MPDRGPFEVLWERTQVEIPGARIVMKKNSLFMKAVFGFLKLMVAIFTLGKGRKEWDGFTTTIGRTVYVPDSWGKRTSARKYMTLRHELIHLRQFRNWPMKFLGHKGIWRINAVIMGFCYLFVFPVFFTLRAKFEREGYTQSMLVRHEMLGLWEDPDEVRKYVDYMAKTFGTSTYLWMWSKKKARKWAMKTIDDIVYGNLSNYQDRIVQRDVIAR